MIIRVPQLDDPAVTKFLTELVRELDKRETERLSAITGNTSLLLYSPSKFVFEVKVTDAGALTVTKVAG